jgi:hypothetical protein
MLKMVTGREKIESDIQDFIQGRKNPYGYKAGHHGGEI